MSRTCSVCSHRDRHAIDAALVAGTPSLRELGAQYGLGPTALYRHQQGHLPPHLVKAAAAEEASDADMLLGQCRGLYAKSVGILKSAEAAGDLRTALSGIREARGCLELLAKLLGQLDTRPIINISTAPEWVQLRGTIVEVLQRYPDAAVAVADELLRLEASA